MVKVYSVELLHITTNNKRSGYIMLFGHCYRGSLTRVTQLNKSSEISSRIPNGYI